MVKAHLVKIVFFFIQVKTKTKNKPEKYIFIKYTWEISSYTTIAMISLTSSNANTITLSLITAVGFNYSQPLLIFIHRTSDISNQYQQQQHERKILKLARLLTVLQQSVEDAIIRKTKVKQIKQKGGVCVCIEEEKPST